MTNYVNSVHQGLCPAGWHVPSAADFDTLYAHAYDESPSTRKLSTDPAERFILNPKGFNLKYAGQLMIWGYEYYMGYKEIDPTAGARYFRTGKRGEYPLSFVYKDFNHFVSFTTTDAEESTVLVYAVYSDQYNFSMGANRIYRGASAEYLRCIKDFECPKGEEFYEGICQKPFNCSEYEYAVDKWNCEMLPDNAHRNKGLGFSCNNGYRRVKKDDVIECMKPYGCKETEYAIGKFECMPLPENAHRKANEKTGYECDEGYDSVEIGLFSYCRKPYECKDNEYSVDKYKCGKLPQNAHRNEEIGFTCNDGYDEIHDGETISCEKGYVCAETEYAVDVKNCAPLPDFATRNEKEGFSCNEGYALYQGECYPISPESY